ncbi:MAG: AraC family transcriptional regulator [Pseudomonadota bacterium]
MAEIMVCRAVFYPYVYSMELEHHHTNLPAGGGPFALDRVTVGVFLTDQPNHRLAVGSDRTIDAPLKRNEGWVLPAGSEGLCLFENNLDLVTVHLDDGLLRECGLQDAEQLPQVIGQLDPILLSMALNAGTFLDGDTLYRDTMVRAMGHHLVRTVTPQRAEAAGLSDTRLKRVVDFIHDHLSDDLSLTAMADLAAMSPTHFAKAFKKATGSAPLQYVISARLDRAKVLLQTTQLTVADVAWRVGYADLSRFGQHFKRQFGITPGKVR